MPPGCEGAESYKDYILGTRDGAPKTPDWAEPITAVPRATIARLAREYATTKPAVLYQGYGMQRRAYGEQAVRAGCVLAAITGNVGIPGGWAGGIALQAPDGGALWTVFPPGENPVKARIPSFLWTEAVLRGKEMGPGRRRPRRGQTRQRTSSSSRPSPRTSSSTSTPTSTGRPRSSRDEKRVEFLVVQDNFLTPTARFADLVLPACTQFETWGVQDGWKYGEEVILMPQDRRPAVRDQERLPDLRSEIAERLGLGDGIHRRPEREGLGRVGASTIPQNAISRISHARRTREDQRRRLFRAGDATGRGLRRFPPRPGKASAAHALGKNRNLFQAPSRSEQAGRDSRPSRNTSGNGKAPSAPKRRNFPSRPSAITPWPASIRPWTTSLARGGLPPTRLHQSRRRRSPRNRRTATRSRFSTTAGAIDRPLPDHRPDHARRRGHPPRRLVDARRRRRRPARQRSTS